MQDYEILNAVELIKNVLRKDAKTEEEKAAFNAIFDLASGFLQNMQTIADSLEKLAEK